MSKQINWISVWILGFALWAGVIHASESESLDRIGFSVIKTGVSDGTAEAVVVQTGSWFTFRALVHNAVLIEHPKGDILVDTGLGQQIEAQFEENNFFDQLVFGFSELDPVVDQFNRADYDKSAIKAIIPTHLHWDHASGLGDFPGIPVWVQESEYNEALMGEAPAFLQSQLRGKINWEFIELSDLPYLGFTKTLDVYRDGSIVLVDLAGHTAGQVGVLLTTTSGKQFLFSGDTTWTLKGIEDNVGRNPLLKWYVDVNWNVDLNKDVTTVLHQLLTSNSDIQIVPAHDEYVAAKLPAFPKYQY